MKTNPKIQIGVRVSEYEMTGILMYTEEKKISVSEFLAIALKKEIREGMFSQSQIEARMKVQNFKKRKN